jgi:hypothetical protein
MGQYSSTMCFFFHILKYILDDNLEFKGLFHILVENWLHFASYEC